MQSYMHVRDPARARVEADLAALPSFHRNRIVDAIEEQLAHQPDVPSRNRKLLRRALPGWQEPSEVWELRVGEFRVFYDVDSEQEMVWVRAVRRKPPHRTTEEIL